MLVFERTPVGMNQLQSLVQPALAQRECLMSTELHDSSVQATATPLRLVMG